jgi:hypothetical protein
MSPALRRGESILNAGRRISLQHGGKELVNIHHMDMRG